MKQTIFILISIFIGLITFSQSSDPYLSTQYLGYENGKHKVKVTNLQSCRVDIQFQYAGPVTGISPNPNNNPEYNSVGGSGSQVFEITGTSSLQIHIKALSICDWKGNMPIWVNPLDNILPVKFTSISAKQISKNEIKVTFEVGEEINVSHYNIRINDGSGFKIYKVLFQGETIKPGTYSTVINIKNTKL